MNNFTFFNPTKIFFGKGQVEQISHNIPTGSKVLITYGGGSIKKNGVLQAVKDNLQGFEFGEFGGIEPNPTYETLMQAVKKVQEEGYNFILAVGGGSVIDGTKFISAAALYEQGDPWEIVQKRLPVEKAVPFAVVLTLPATGSEMNNGAVITYKSKKTKLAFGSDAVFPKFSVLDPMYTFTLPPRQIGNGVVDTFVHVFEQYMTYPVNGMIQDRFSEGILLTLLEEGPKALENPSDYDVRANLMLAATMALNGLICMGVPQDWSTHMIGHEITALYGIDHARTLAIVLPSLLEVMKEDKKEKLLQYAQRIWYVDAKLPEDEQIAIAIQRTREFFEKMQIKCYLSEYDLPETCVEEIVANLERHNMTALGERKNMTLEISRKILQKAYKK